MAKWRVGRKIPLNVYDGDRPVCQCHVVEDAYRIVAAVNAHPAPKHFMDLSTNTTPPMPFTPLPPMLDCKGVEPGSRTGKVKLRKG